MVDGSSVAQALADLTGGRATVEYSGWRERQGLLALEAGFALVFAEGGLWLAVEPEADLLRVCVARLLNEDFELGWADSDVDAALRGAGGALALEVVRRAALAGAPRLELSRPAKDGWLLGCTLTVRLGDRPFRCQVWAGEPSPGSTSAPSPPVGAHRRGRLSALGRLTLALPWVLGSCVATASEVQTVAVGDVWLPGAGWFGDPRSESAWSPMSAAR